jgi:hypothetical protein
MTSDEYFEVILKANRKAHLAAPDSLVAAFNYASSLFHFHEWLLKERQPELEAHFKITLKKERDIDRARECWSEMIEKTDTSFGYIRDAANASKHCVLTSTTSTDLKNGASVRRGWTGFGQGRFGEGPYGGSRIIVLVAGDKTVDFNEVAERLFSGPGAE